MIDVVVRSGDWERRAFPARDGMRAAVRYTCSCYYIDELGVPVGNLTIRTYREPEDAPPVHIPPGVYAIAGGMLQVREGRFIVNWDAFINEISAGRGVSPRWQWVEDENGARAVPLSPRIVKSAGK